MKPGLFWLLLFVLLPAVGAGQIITTVAGNGINGNAGEGGPATMASLSVPYGGTFDSSWNYYFVEAGNNKVRVLTRTGKIYTIAGNGTAGYSGDGGPATSAKLNNPQWVTTDAIGNIYISDAGNKRIRKIDTAGIIHTIAGNGTAGYSGDGGPATAASLDGLGGTCIDISGNIYISANNRIRKINASGIIITIAGNGTQGFTGDGGPSIAAELFPHGIYVDRLYNLFVSDFDRIRKIDASTNTIHTIAGTGSGSYNGDEIPATAANFSNIALAWDANGNIFIADMGNNRVRKIDTTGIIHTIAGNGTASYSGDGGSATAAGMYDPSGLAFDECGNLIITVKQDFRIRKVIYNPSCDPKLAVTQINSISGISIHPIPATTEITITCADKINEVGVYDMVGRTMQVLPASAATMQVNVSGLAPGVYFVRVVGEDGEVVVRRFVKE